MAVVASRHSALNAAAVPVASIVANIASYALLLAAAHLMTAADYGTLSSLLGVLLISTVPTLALQTVAARRAATAQRGPDAVDSGLRGMARGTATVALAATLVLVVISPAVALFLHLDSVLGVLLVAGTIPGTSLLGTAMGVAQGRRVFRRLAVLILVTIGGRSLGGLAGLLVHRTTTSTLIGVFTGISLAAALVALSDQGFTRHRAALRLRAQTGVVNETLHAAHAHGLFLLLTSLDVLLARHVLTPSVAGLYAAGSVITRAALWLPQSAVLLMFASLAETHRHGVAARRAITVVGLLGVLTVAATAALSSLAVTLVGGHKYHALDGIIWLFALLGALLALVQLAVQAGLAQRRVRRAALLWLTIAADVIVVLSTSHHATAARLVTTLVVVTSAAAVGAVLLTMRQVVAPDGQGGEM